MFELLWNRQASLMKDAEGPPAPPRIAITKSRCAEDLLGVIENSILNNIPLMELFEEAVVKLRVNRGKRWITPEPDPEPEVVSEPEPEPPKENEVPHEKLRELTSHKVTALNEALKIVVLDEPGMGGACHHYDIYCDESKVPPGTPSVLTEIRFQNGTIGASGINGISGESLLAIIEDRLKCFQEGKYACRENELALMHIQEAMMWLHSRTRERLQRGVEGTHAK